MLNNSYEYNSLTLNSQTTEFLSGVRSLIDWDYVLTNVEGLDSAGVRETRENKPALHGQDDYGQYLAERLITFEGFIQAQSISNLEILRQDLLDHFVNDGAYHWLKFTPTGSEAKQVYCKVLNRNIGETLQDIKYKRDFLINFVAIDPRIYSQTENVDTIYIPSATGGRGYAKTYAKAYGTIQTGGKATLNNLGNFDSLPTVKLYGPLSIPKIKNNSDSAKEIQIDTTVSAGDYLEIDFTDHTIMLNGTASRYNYLNSLSNWWVIKPGSNDIEFRDSGGDTDGYAQLTWRSAWI